MQIPVFYTPAQTHNAGSYSKSPMKPTLVATAIADDPAFQLISDGIHAATLDEVSSVHEFSHVMAIIDGAKPDGFGNSSVKDNVAIRTTVGNFMAAAQHEADVVWSLTSGFHHARFDSCGGFCTFNALNMAALKLWVDRKERTLIVDGDAHYGDGCADIIERCDQSRFLRYFQSRYDHGMGWDPVEYRRALEKVIDSHDADAIFYQAGADAWAGDPLGGSCDMSMAQLYERDIITLSAAKARGIRVVVNLAGGYAENYEDTIRIHRNTGEAMKEVYLGRGAAEITDEQ